MTVHVSVTQRGDALGTPVPMTVTFAAASTTVELVLPTVDDAVDEVDAVVTVTLVAGTDDYHVVDGLGDSATVTVADNDLPEVSIASAGGVTEGEAAVFTLTRIGVTNDALTVNVSVTQSGDALGGQIPPVAFAANATTTELSVGTVDDAVDEVDAVVTATLAPGTGYRVVAAPGNRATVTVADNDLPEVSIASAGNVTEGEAAVFTLTRSGVTSDPLTVNVSVTQSGDALGSPIPPVAFAPNAATTELSLGTVDDAVDEEDAVVTVTLMAGTGYRVVDGLGDRATVTVADNDLPEVSIASAGNVTEGEAAVFTLTRSGVTSDALTVNVSVTQSGNTLGGQIPPVAFAANATTTELSVGTVDDAVDAADNMVTATLAPGTGYNVVDGLGDRATVTVADNDLPEVSITSAGGVTEGEAAVFTLTRSGVTSDPLTVNVSVTQSGNTLGGPIPPVAFAANATTTELSVGTVDDAVDAADNVVTATVAPGTGYNVVAAPGNRATVTVADNDLPEVSIASAGNVTEGEAAVFTLTRSGVTTDALTVNVSVSQRGDALGAPVPATATFAADGATAELSVPTVDDAVDEEDAVVTAALAAGGYRIAAAPGDRATVTVADNDLPEVSIASAGGVTEGEAAVFTLTRSGVTTDALTVNVSVTQRGDALGAPVPTTATFAPNGATAELAVPTVDDAVDEEPAVVTATLEAGTGSYRIAAAPGNRATVTVADNDLPEVSIASAGGVTEGEAAVFTLTRSGVTTDALTVNVSVSQRGDALGAPVPTTATFAADDATAELAVPTVDDAVGEVDAVVTATLAPGTGYNVVAAPGDRATVTVADNDLPEVSIASAGNVTEGEAAVFTLTRSGVTSDPLTVNVSVTQSGDALGSPIPPVAFAPNAATTELSVGTVDDAVDEVDAVVTATLAPGTGYNVVDGPGNRATVTVADNDLPEVSITSAGNVTEGEAAVFTLTRSGVTSDPLTVNVSVTQSGLTLGGRIPPVAFAPNAATTELSVGTVDDAVDEVDAVVTATLAPGTGYNVVDGPGNRATVTVADNDFPEVSIASAGGVTEGEAAVFTLTRSGVTSDPLTVNVSVTQSGNTLGSRIPPVAFAANATTTELSVGTVDDAVDAADNVVTATVAPGTGYRVVAAPGDRATVTVADNDLPEVSIASAGNVTEGEAAVFTLTRIGVTTDPLTVNVSVTQRGDALGAPVPATATFAPNGATAELAVPTVDDAVDEEDAVVTAALAAGGYRIAAAPGDRATVTVADNDLPEVSIAAAGGVTEGEPAVFTLTRIGLTDDALTVDVSVNQRGDVLGTCAAIPAGFRPWSLPPNAATAELSVPTVDDAVDEEDTVVTATLAAGTGYNVVDAPGDSATVTVADNDHPTVSFELSTYVVAEGESVTVRAVLSEPPGEDTVVPLAIVRGDGLTDEDFSGVPSSLVFAAGETEASFVLAAHRDRIDEEDELVKLSFAETVPVEEPSSARVTLRDTYEQDHRDQRNRVAEEYVPGLGGTLAGIVTQTLGGRLAQPGLPRGDRLEIGGHEVRLAANDIDAAVGGTLAGASHDTMPARADRFAMSLGAAGDGDRTGGSGHGWAIWAEGAGTGFSDDDGDLAIDGTVVSGAGGIEHAGGDWLGGLALFHSRARAVYEMPLLGERLSDDIEARLTSAIPYLRWSPDAATMVWGAAGRGWGHMTLSDPTGAYETDIEMTMGAFGASRRVLSEGFDLAVKSDAFWTRITSDETEDLDQVKGVGYRLRAGVEGGQERRLGNGVRLRPSLEAGVRKDGGDTGARGTGLEVGGGIAYEHPGLGLTAEASGRVLLLHSNEGYEEWGVAGRLRLEPGSDGRGLSFALEPALGAAASGASRVWQDGRFGSPTGEWTAQGRVALSLGYAMPVFEPAGRLTPHARMTFNDDGSQHYGAGFDLTLGPDFVLGLQSVHRFDNDSEHAVQLTSTLRW